MHRHKGMTSSQIAQEFIAAINSHDADAIMDLCSPDHVFVDSLGNTVPGSKMRAGWQGYFCMVPDYWIRIDEVICERETVMLAGVAGGTYVPSGGERAAKNKWETPAVFQARIRDGKVTQWRVYCDNEPIREKMRAAAAQPS
jgi:ketosteroid isomerase-like protein